MKKTLIYLFLALLAFPMLVQAQGDAISGMLWKVSKVGQKDSYLLGTIHLATNELNYTYWDTLAVYRRIMDEVEAVGVEIDIFGEASVLAEHTQKAQAMVANKSYPVRVLMPDSIASYSSLFADTAEYNLVVKVMDENIPQEVKSMFDFSRFKPFYTTGFLRGMVAMNKMIRDMKAGKKLQNPATLKIIDTGILQQGKDNGKQLLYMELAQEQIDMFAQIDSLAYASVSLQEQARMLYEYCHLLSEGIAQDSVDIAQAVELYKKNDLMGVAYFQSDQQIKVKNKQVQAEAWHLMMTRRNLRWLPKIVENLQQRSCLIAVGCGHLVGEKGLVNLLRHEGYTVVSVSIN